MEDYINDIFARACKNNEYFGKDGWYELHTPTLKKEILALIHTREQQAVEEAFSELLSAPKDSWYGTSREILDRLATLNKEQK